MPIIEKVEIATTKTGKPYKKVTIAGKTASVWSNDPLYNEYNPGADLDVLIVPDGKYHKIVRNDGVVVTVGSSRPMDHADKTRRNVEDAQSSKDHAIRQSSTFRDATLIALAQTAHEPFPTPADFKANWQTWRKWLWSQWEYQDFTENKPPEDWAF